MNTIIAEAGSNHNGDKDMAKKLVEIAKSTKATSIKFQFIFPEGLYLPYENVEGSVVPSSVYQVREKEQLTAEEWSDVWKFSHELGIDISASVFCSRGVALLRSLGAKYVKIASTDVTNLSLIRLTCENFDKVIISTGMAKLEEIAKTVSMVRTNFPEVDLKLMHCVSIYPCEFEQSQLNRINALRTAFDIEVGYSDHTENNTSSVLAWQMGVRLFEKHFTHDKTASGFDHLHAQDLEGLKDYVSILDKCESAVYWSPFLLDSAQEITKIRARRGIYASRDLPVGHIICEDDLLHVRPSTKAEATDISELIGFKLEQPMKKYTAIGLSKIVNQFDTNWREAQDYWSKEMTHKKMDK
jgi:sialic acid synthase SpsE